MVVERILERVTSVDEHQVVGTVLGGQERGARVAGTKAGQRVTAYQARAQVDGNDVAEEVLPESVRRVALTQAELKAPATD